MINNHGWKNYSIWAHSSVAKTLYEKRARLEDVELTCHAQAVELLTPHLSTGDSVLDVGCGSGYFYHSFKKRDLKVEYLGIDPEPTFIETGRGIMPAYGLPAENLQVMRVEDLDGDVDHVLSLIVLSNIDNYHRPLERMLKMARKTVILRESFHETAQYSYVGDKYLDQGILLNVYVNAYPKEEVRKFVESYGYEVQYVTDRHTGGKAEMVIDYPHYWTFMVAVRKGS